MNSKDKRKSKIQKIGLVIGSFILSIFFSEIVLNLFSFNYIDSNWDHWESLSGSVKAKSYIYDKDIGFVKSEMDIPKKVDGEYRIVFLGDSITEFGLYIKKMQTLIKNKFPKKKITLINAGTVGYNTEIEYRFLKKFYNELQPDLLIQQFCLNDFGYTPVIIKSGDSFIALNSGIFDFFPQWIVDKSETLKLLSISSSKIFSYFQNLTNISYITDQQNRSVKNNIINIKKYVESNNSEYRLLLLPYFTSNKIGDFHYNRINSIIKEIQISKYAIDTKALFETHKMKDYRLSSDDYTHPNELASKMIAQNILKNITNNLE